MIIALPPSIFTSNTLLVFFFYQSQDTLLQARRAPFPFPLFPLLFPIVILRTEITCFLMPLIPLREVSPKLPHLKLCLNPLLLVRFIAPHSISR